MPDYFFAFASLCTPILSSIQPAAMQKEVSDFKKKKKTPRARNIFLTERFDPLRLQTMHSTTQVHRRHLGQNGPIYNYLHLQAVDQITGLYSKLFFFLFQKHRVHTSVQMLEKPSRLKAENIPQHVQVPQCRNH